eukprot:g19256.t1
MFWIFHMPNTAQLRKTPEDAAWRMNLKEDFISFIFQAPNKARMLSNIAGGSSEPPRMGWKPACELKGRVAVELFREAMRQPLQVPSEELERFVKVLRGVGDEQNFVFRKLEEPLSGHPSDP